MRHVTKNKLSYYLNKASNLDLEKFEKKIRIAILSSFTLNGLAETMKVKCSESKMGCIAYVGPYNQYNQEILNPASKLYEFSPELTYLFIDSRKLLGDLFYFPYSISSTQRKDFVNNKVNEIKKLITTFKKNSKSKLVISNFDIPAYSPYGIFESKADYGLQEMTADLNSKISELAREDSSVYVYDFNGFVMKFGQANIFDYSKFFYGDVKIAFDFIPYLAHDLIGYVKPIFGINKKCIVLDLDNTLWGGIVGEDGFEGIKLGLTPPGNAFIEFQKRLLALHQRGIILAINSKNNPEDALQVITNYPNMILREEHFASMKINWDDKISNMREIADEINIGLDSMVYFDDDPVNRELIRMKIPEILTINLPNDPSQYSRMLEDLNDFNVLKITEEDLKRGKMYYEDRQRGELEKTAPNLDDFLKQLNIKLKIQDANRFTIPRISQLTLKTNQFNLTTRRYQEEDIAKLANDKDTLVKCVQVEDKFGDNGITGVIIVKKDNKAEWTIDTFLLSCRVMGRGVEEGMLGHILELARKEGVSKVKGIYIPTKKNKPSEDFLSNFGFRKENGHWVYTISNSIKIPQHLTVIASDNK
jgi:FkbH-like protein